MTRIRGVVIGAYSLLKPYLFIIVGLEGLHFLINSILGMSGLNQNPEVSAGNIVTSFLIIMAIILPIFLFKRILNLGASRGEYYIGSIVTYILFTAVFSLFNIVWYSLEINVFVNYKNYFNIIEILNWNQHGKWGMFVYQFADYLLAISFFSFIVTSLKSKLGIVLSLIIAGVLSSILSIKALRTVFVEGLAAVIMNPNIVVGTLLTLVAASFFFVMGWNFISKREI
ncbi:hypothetical protein AMQ84_17980 [Paenibacillus riograndensis]|uniref:Uncharacterized protein n=1 Tax=Paenibacillus riograndensis TaxID=483937 RepID=A0A132TVW6_9BACL|nr:hypothetical protein [Paenibacillus riograndensis]KWX75505.1 hypothetical protein AMQ84_17980 [Paenibacillus riograndensis]KWX87691.1 hypothetical protein AMQ83_11560 [Paenibacillus riograndensis]